MNTGLKYCCPKCKNEFGVAKAERTNGVIQLTASNAQLAIPVNVPLVHILCPECRTIVTSFTTPTTL